MKHFTIENETNNVTIHGSAKDAEAVPNSERFGSEAALSKLATDWPMSRLVEIWNSLPGETQVKKFKDRATAVARIWKAIQTLGGAEASQPEAEPATGEVTEADTATDVRHRVRTSRPRRLRRGMRPPLRKRPLSRQSIRRNASSCCRLPPRPKARSGTR